MASKISVMNRVRMFEDRSTPRGSSEPVLNSHPFNRSIANARKLSHPSTPENNSRDNESRNPSPQSHARSWIRDRPESPSVSQTGKSEKPDSKLENKGVLKQTFNLSSPRASGQTRVPSWKKDQNAENSTGEVKECKAPELISKSGTPTAWSKPFRATQRQDFSNVPKESLSAEKLFSSKPLSSVQRFPSESLDAPPDPGRQIERTSFSPKVNQSLIERSPFKHVVSRDPNSNEKQRESQVTNLLESQRVKWPSPDNKFGCDDEILEFKSQEMLFEEENKIDIPSDQTSHKLRTSRALRLKRQKKPIALKTGSGLKHSLEAASVILAEERSNSGSSSASSRSSLSNQELSNIASRAMSLAQSSSKKATAGAVRTVPSRPGLPVGPSPQNNRESSTTPQSAQSSLTESRNDSRRVKLNDGDEALSETSEARLANRFSRAGKLAQALRRAASNSRQTETDGYLTPNSLGALSEGSKISSASSTIRNSNKDAGASDENFDPTDPALETSEPNHSSTQKGQPALPAAVRGARTVTRVSHQEARRALLTAAQKRREKGDPSKQVMALNITATNQPDDEAAPSTRLESRVSRVLALKNSTKAMFGRSSPCHEDANGAKTQELNSGQSQISKRGKEHSDDVSVVGSVTSVDTKSSRRSQHPAFAARASPRLDRPSSRTEGDLPHNEYANKTKVEAPKPKTEPEDQKPAWRRDPDRPFAEELFSSLRHFATRPKSDPDNGVNPPGK